MQNLLVAHGLGRRHHRLARAAAITAATTGLITEIARDEMLFGFCRLGWSKVSWVSIDSFYSENLKGVGKGHQLTAVDVHPLGDRVDRPRPRHRRTLDRVPRTDPPTMAATPID